MGETYTRLYSLPERLYTMGAPVVVAAGALLKDNRNGNIIVQLKIQNIYNKTIKAVTVKVASMDTVGRTLGEETEYRYLDLNVKRNEFFGQQVPIVVPDEQTRSYSVKVTEAVFDDNTVWTGNEIWEPLENPDPIEKKIANGELVRQYRIKYGKNSKYLLKQEKDLWFCTCGVINHESELSCCSCHIDRTKLEELDMDALKKHQAQYPERWKATFEYLKNTDLGRLSAGEHEIIGREVYAIVSEYTPKEATECNFEAHRKYIDFQYLISGKEKMGVTTLDKVVPICEYDEEKDIVFFKPDASAIYEVATPDLFYVFFPKDPHRPSIKDEDGVTVKKIVIKIKM